MAAVRRGALLSRALALLALVLSAALAPTAALGAQVAEGGVGGEWVWEAVQCGTSICIRGVYEYVSPALPPVGLEALLVSDGGFYNATVRLGAAVEAYACPTLVAGGIAVPNTTLCSAAVPLPLYFALSAAAPARHRVAYAPAGQVPEGYVMIYDPVSLAVEELRTTVGVNETVLEARGWGHLDPGFFVAGATGMAYGSPVVPRGVAEALEVFSRGVYPSRMSVAVLAEPLGSSTLLVYAVEAVYPADLGFKVAVDLGVEVDVEPLVVVFTDLYDALEALERVEGVPGGAVEEALRGLEEGSTARFMDAVTSICAGAPEGLLEAPPRGWGLEALRAFLLVCNLDPLDPYATVFLLNPLQYTVLYNSLVQDSVADTLLQMGMSSPVPMVPVMPGEPRNIAERILMYKAFHITSFAAPLSSGEIDPPPPLPAASQGQAPSLLELAKRVAEAIREAGATVEPGEGYEELVRRALRSSGEAAPDHAAGGSAAAAAAATSPQGGAGGGGDVRATVDVGGAAGAAAAGSGPGEAGGYGGEPLGEFLRGIVGREGGGPAVAPRPTAEPVSLEMLREAVEKLREAAKNRPFASGAPLPAGAAAGALAEPLAWEASLVAGYALLSASLLFAAPAAAAAARRASYLLLIALRGRREPSECYRLVLGLLGDGGCGRRAWEGPLEHAMRCRGMLGEELVRLAELHLQQSYAAAPVEPIECRGLALRLLRRLLRRRRGA